MNGQKTMFQGQASAYRVASELLMRGLNVAFPAVDTGIDLLVENCVRVQIKSAHVSLSRRKDRPSTAPPLPTYGFRLTCNVWNGARMEVRSRKWSGICDFLILWGIEEDRFWIVPSALLDGRYSVVLGTTGEGKWRNADMEAIRRLRLAGNTCEQIAEALNLSTMTVSRRLRGMFLENTTNPLIQQIRSCEGQWEVIAQYIATLTEATRQVAKTPKVAEGVSR